MLRQRPLTDTRLMLALDLGCFSIANLRISPADQKKDADAMWRRIRPRTAHLMDSVLDEMKGILLEMRSGELRAIDAPPSVQTE